MARYRNREWANKTTFSEFGEIVRDCCKKNNLLWLAGFLTTFLILSLSLSCKIAHRTLPQENPYEIETTDSEQTKKLVGTNRLDDVSYSTTGEGQVLVSFSREPDYSGDWDGNIFILRVQNCRIGKTDGKIQPSDFLKRVQWAQHENDVVWIVLEFATKPDLKVGIAGNTLVLQWKHQSEEPPKLELVWSVHPLPDSVIQRMKQYSSPAGNGF